MCGIAGIVTWGETNNLGKQARRMISPLYHRGPDDFGVWEDNRTGVALGHRRLSILDLSSSGHQPMHSVSGRYVIAYNGEIYNFAQIREELIQQKLAPQWQGHSDTEVLLAAIDAWGLLETIKKTRGMFALALWDKKEKQLSLVRDRIGEKPLYYGNVNGQFVFASELKAIKAIADKGLQIDRDALVEYMRFGYIPSPLSIYKGIKKLTPGHVVTIHSISNAGTPQAYWSLDSEEQKQLRSERDKLSEKKLINLVHEQLTTAVGLQMHSDVPLGAFLSGGVDSSAIVSLMQAQSDKKIRTFTIGFNEKDFDEAPYAKAVAEHLGTEHTELYVTAQDAEAIVPEIPVIYDEPFADSSQIPTTLVSRLTRQHVTVSLSGDGGDELFAGYPRYQLTEALWNRVDGVPMPVRKTIAGMLKIVSAQGWDKVLCLLPKSKHQSINGRRLHRLAQLMTCSDIGEMYLRLMSQWQPEEQLVLGTNSYRKSDFDLFVQKSPIEAMRRWDVQQYLCDDLLVKVDRASMSASLESRAPLLDHKVVELAFSLPERALINNGVGKWVLRRVLDRYVPGELIERPKVGFSVPLGDWLKGPLRDWAEALLSPQLLIRQGLLDEKQVSFMWQQHLSGQYDRSTYLWNILMFQSWYDVNG